MSSFADEKNSNYIRSQPKEYVRYNIRQLSRVYPEGKRIASSNYMPQGHWDVGCQLVALNFQTPGTAKYLMLQWLAILLLIMPRCACASEVYGSVFVCVCVCVCRLLQLLKDELSASKSFYRLLVMFTWILIRGFAK